MFRQTTDELAFKKIVEKKYGKRIHEAFDENKKCLDEDEVKKIILELFKGKKVSRSILDAYNYFYKEIRNHVQEDPKKKITNFLQTVKSNFELVQITPGQSQHAEEIFESINATGRKLSEFDYLRNNLFLRARDKSEEFYRDFWIFEDDPDDYDWTDDRLESFFQAFLMAKLGPKILNKDAKLFDLYQLQVSPGRTLKEEFEDIKNYAETYKKLDVDLKFAPRMQFYEDLSTFYTKEDEESYNPVKGVEYNYYVTVIRSFIMYLQQELDGTNDEILRVFEILESYVARSLLVDTVANYDSYQVIRTFFSDLFLKRDKAFLLGNMMEYLANRSKRRWIPNTVVKNWFSGEKLLITWHGPLREDRQFSLRYIFYRIENWRRKAAEKEQLDFTEEEFPPDKDSVRTFTQLKLNEEAWRSLGNLTFCWKDNHERNGTLELNSGIYNEPKLEWEHRQIKNRETKLVSAFCNLWPPHPWENMRYKELQEVPGTVVRIEEDGMYVQLEPAIEGYVSRFEMTWSHRRKIIPSEHFKEGTKINKVRIIGIEKSKQEIRLSIRQTQPYPWTDIDTRYSVNQEVEGTVIEIDQSTITLEIEPGVDGVIANEEIAWTPHRNVDPADYVNEGEQIKAKILEISKYQQILRLSIRQTQSSPWKDIDTKYLVDTEVQGTVIEIDQSSVTLELEQGIGGRVDNSEIAWTPWPHDRVIPSEHFKQGDEVIANILEISEAEQKISLSIKQTQDNNPWKDIDTRYSVGTEVEGTVIEIDQYGAIFELEPGVHGSIHRDEMVWTNSSKDIVPSEIVNKGEKIKAKILEISEEKESLRLSIKRTQPDPWVKFTQNNKEGTVVRGKICDITKFGAFAELEKGILGLIRISELADKRLEKPEEVVSLEDELDLKIIKIDEKEKKISLSLKAVPWKDIDTRYSVGTEVEGTVIEIDQYGAIFELEPGVHGSIHRDEMVWTNSSKDIVPSEIVNKGEKIKAKILEISEEKESLRLSIKRTQPDPWVKFTQNNKEGTVVRGKIVRFTDFGAFAELSKGIEGLIHISELANRRLEKPEEVVSFGEELDLEVIKMDEKKRQISLSLKAVWAKIAEKYKVDTVVQGKIVKLDALGALVELGGGIEGLIRKYELAGRPEKPSIGTELKVKVIRVNREERQIHLREVTPTLMETRMIAAMKKKY